MLIINCISRMKMNRFLGTLIIILCFSLNSIGQTDYSPYSIFGSGLISNRNFGVNQALGGTGIALQSNKYLNQVNPASYSGIDSLSFLFDVGVFGKYSVFQTNTLKQQKFNGNISSLSIGFRVFPWLAMSAGVIPFSSMDYNIHSVATISGTDTKYEKLFTGSGSINQVFIGTSLKPIKNLSIGIHGSYLFGSFVQRESANLPSDFGLYAVQKTTQVNTFKLDYGIQYFFSVGNWKYGIGAVYGNMKDLYSSTVTKFGYSNDTVDLITNDDQTRLLIPENYGVGISTSFKNKYTFAADYERKLWSEIAFNNPLLKSRNSERYSFGFEYNPSSDIHKAIGLQRLYYRLGANFNASYMVIDNTPINSKGLSIGVGVPLERQLSIMNFSLEFGSIGTLHNYLIRENYVQFNLNFTLRDIWFLKPKYD
jgi:hypothetical protein